MSHGLQCCDLHWLSYEKCKTFVDVLLQQTMVPPVSLWHLWWTRDSYNEIRTPKGQNKRRYVGPCVRSSFTLRCLVELNATIRAINWCMRRRNGILWSQLQRLQSQNLQPSTVHITATFQATNVITSCPLDIITSTRIIFLVQAQTLHQNFYLVCIDFWFTQGHSVWFTNKIFTLN